MKNVADYLSRIPLSDKSGKVLNVISDVADDMAACPTSSLCGMHHTLTVEHDQINVEGPRSARSRLCNTLSVFEHNTFL